MASKAVIRWRSMVTRMAGNRSIASSTTPKMKPAVDASHADETTLSKYWLVGDKAPIMVLAGMLIAAGLIGIHTAKQQLVYSPSVRVNKKRRQSLVEVEDPSRVVASADKFVNKSFARKVSYIKEDTRTLADPSRPNPFTRARNAESLQSVGIDPRRI